MNSVFLSVAVYLFDPAAPCSYSLPVSDAPAVPLAMPFFLAISAASSGFVPVKLQRSMTKDLRNPITMKTKIS